jgi:hypothetical protein
MNTNEDSTTTKVKPKRRIPRVLCVYYLSIAATCWCYFTWKVSLSITLALIVLRIIRRRARAARARDLDAPISLEAQLPTKAIAAERATDELAQQTV